MSLTYFALGFLLFLSAGLLLSLCHALRDR